MTATKWTLSLVTCALLAGCDGNIVLSKEQKAALKQCEAENADTEVFWMSTPDKIYRIVCVHKDTEAFQK